MAATVPACTEESETNLLGLSVKSGVNNTAEEQSSIEEKFVAQSEES